MATVACSRQSKPDPQAAAEPVRGPELVCLRDGTQLTVRRVQARDEAALRVFLHGLCEDARRLRFFGVAVDTDRAAHWAAEMSGKRCGLVAYDEAGAIVGHAAFIVLDARHAEVAVEVADNLHGRGLGTLLIERLAVIAEQRRDPVLRRGGAARKPGDARCVPRRLQRTGRPQ